MPVELLLSRPTSLASPALLRLAIFLHRRQIWRCRSNSVCLGSGHASGRSLKGIGNHAARDRAAGHRLDCGRKRLLCFPSGRTHGDRPRLYRIDYGQRRPLLPRANGRHGAAWPGLGPRAFIWSRGSASASWQIFARASTAISCRSRRCSSRPPGPAKCFSRLAADTTLVQTVVGSSASLALRSIVMSIGAIVLMAITSPKLPAWPSSASQILLGLIMVMGRRVRGLSRTAQDRLAETSALAGETINAIRRSRPTHTRQPIVPATAARRRCVRQRHTRTACAGS